MNFNLSNQTFSFSWAGEMAQWINNWLPKWEFKYTGHINSGQVWQLSLIPALRLVRIGKF